MSRRWSGRRRGEPPPSVRSRDATARLAGRRCRFALLGGRPGAQLLPCIGDVVERRLCVLVAEKEGLELMRKLKDEGFDINVFDRNTPLTDIVDKALQAK